MVVLEAAVLKPILESAAQGIAKAAGSATVSAFMVARRPGEHDQLLTIVARSIVEQRTGADYSKPTRTAWHFVRRGRIATLPRRGDCL